MNKLLVSSCTALLLVAGAATAQAQSSTTTNQPAAMNMRQQITDQLTKSGYTDITVMPSSFFVSAKDKKGDPVAMVIGPDSFTEVTDLVKNPKASTDTTKPDTTKQ